MFCTNLQRNVLPHLLLLLCLGLCPLASAREPAALMTSKPDTSKLGAHIKGLKTERDVKLDDGRVATLQANQYMLGLSYDVLPWLALSLDIGAADGKLQGLSDFDKYQFSWGCGVEATAWTIEIEPARVHVKARAEFAQSRLGGQSDLDWYEFNGAGLVELELRASRDVADVMNALALSLHAGPAYSTLNGRFDDGFGKQDFHERKSFGLIAGLDVPLNRAMSLAAFARFFDSADGNGYTTTWGGSFSYHF